VVGAQAIYLQRVRRTLPFPIHHDGDLVLDIDALIDEPTLGEIMDGARLSPVAATGVLDQRGRHPSSICTCRRRSRVWTSWGSPRTQETSLLARPGGSRRPSSIAPSNAPCLRGSDQRVVTVDVAGPAALLVSKLHKIAEREGQLERSDDKDAHDV